MLADLSTALTQLCAAQETVIWAREGKAVTMVLSVCRLILAADIAGASTGGQALHERLACLICSRVLGCLAAVISQARLLTPKEQVHPLPSYEVTAESAHVPLDSHLSIDTSSASAPASATYRRFEEPFSCACR